MAHLLLLGSWQELADVAALLHAEHVVTLIAGGDDDRALSPADGPRFQLLIAEAGSLPSLEAAATLAKRLGGLVWLACCSSSEPALAAAAYRAGALAVLPPGSPPELIQRTAARLLLSFAGRGAAAAGRKVAPAHAWPRLYRAGEHIPLQPESVLDIEEGIVAMTVLHADGAEILLGLCGAGQTLPGHPEDACCIQLRAQTAARVQVRTWVEASRNPAFGERLRERLRLMEAWAAMQARPQIEQRLLGILSLLAAQFGRPAPLGTRIEVKVTHAQLASAVGATRTTVTRLLGDLRRRGLLSYEGSGSGERFCLRDWIETHGSRAGGSAAV